MLDKLSSLKVSLRPHPTSPSRRAFTLIELLICVAIIGLLVALLIPSLRQARVSSQSAVCKSNLRGLTRAAAMYEGEYGVVMPYSSGSIYWDGNSTSGFINPYINNPKQVDNAMGGAGDAIRKNKIWYCPVMPLFQGNVVFPQVHYGLDSYGFSVNPLTGAVSGPLLKLVDIRNPAGTVQFADVGYLSSPTAPYFTTNDQILPPSLALSSIPSSSSSYQGHFNGRHSSGTGNVAWYDGHVDEQLPVIPTDNPTWTPVWNKWHYGYLSPVSGPITTSQFYYRKGPHGKNDYFFADPESGRLVESPQGTNNF